MNAELEAIKERIRKLSAVTIEAGSSEAEVIKACEVIGKLLQKHNLTMTEVELRQEQFVQRQIWSGGVQKGGSYFALGGIAIFTGTKVWTSRTAGPGKGLYYVFFGQESDVDMAEYLFKMIDRTVESETEKFKRSHDYAMARGKKGASSSFSTGMGCRIGERLKTMQAANQAEETAARGNNALIVLKGQLMEQAFKATETKLSKSMAQTRITSKDAFRLGGAAGDKVNLSRPLSGGSSASPRMLTAA